MSDSELQPSNASNAPLVEHLIELRSRVLRIVLSVLVVFLSLFYFANDIYLFVSEPLRSILPEGAQMIATEVASPFLAPFKLTLFTAFLVSVPYILYQIWSFIAPGLYEHEKKLAFPLLGSSIVLFYAGMIFAYYVVFPLLFAFFTKAAPEGVTVMTDINAYLSFVLKLFFAFGLAFEIPVATVLLVLAGITSVEGLVEKRPYVILGCFVVGMLLTPPDVFSQTLLAVPMWLLFEVGILISRFLPKDKNGSIDSEI
ncbi:MAG TPA: twin-arginine translocase subunit TatC [Marinospirillum sp.]|uniref:twin-arginine translocase subunit TatC n=1 Tax=Marinospirillum sp. TaxID=2183934 RepID=UPI002B4638CF|nr:twin-arginine translocase subunit TatC [Marinospirillum sp.]HKM14738.1 twin-arginine translocase subunit TatC [Marinospirillum sp.]